MQFSRMTAAILVICLIAVVALASIGITMGVGKAITHGNNVEHQHGIIQPRQMGGNSFVLKADGGQMVQFQCSQRCLSQLGHIQRHIVERAPTDVYYTRGPNNTLIAVDVD